MIRTTFPRLFPLLLSQLCASENPGNRQRVKIISIPPGKRKYRKRRTGPRAMAKKTKAWTAMPEPIIAQSFSFSAITDMLVIIAVAGLWIVWWRNLNRLHKTECLLADSIRQLDQASSQLQQAMDHIRALENKKRIAEESRIKNPPGPRPAPAANPSADTILVRTLRLQREGKPDEEIAGSLGIPVNQVRLMLKMHTAKAG